MNEHPNEQPVMLRQMSADKAELSYADAVRGHPLWVRICHWVVSASALTLAFSGFVILMAHPRLYWGEGGNNLTPALVELPISPNSHHNGGWENAAPFFQDPAGPVSASRTYHIFNKNGWARSLHFLAAWLLAVSGAGYLIKGLFGGHFRTNIWPQSTELAPRLIWRDVIDHLHFRIVPRQGGRDYGVLQKCAYSFVVFVLAPLLVASGLAMAPAITAALPSLLSFFGGYQSARTIHFVTFVMLLAFVVVHVVMVIQSGFRRQLRAMTVGT